ncbi:RNA polymerase sigma factor SigM [uncultured Pseudokineococcus sp.]|uniref:RNA polymerase sigma factor SigM n=1 Tax=uncultured Pseudokineococcus sp. TaxID=1642928 RepID=UPI002623947D|nr:RNA polymerase sigma factor SigM [uncultured Pseudokineococcus sp.]
MSAVRPGALGPPGPRDEGGPGAAGQDVRDQDDAALLRAHVRGEPDAFAELVRRHGPRLWAVALGVLGDREEAADAVQDAFVSALRGADRFRGEAAVTTWLHRIVVNASLDRLRRARVRRTVPLDAPAPGGGDAPRGAVERLAARGDAAADVDLEVDVRAALDRLPDHQRAALVLVDLQDLPVAEAAGVLGVAVGTVKSRCARGRTALAALLRERGLDPRAPAAPARPSGPSGSGAAAGGAGSGTGGNRTGRRDVREGGAASRREEPAGTGVRDRVAPDAAPHDPAPHDPRPPDRDPRDPEEVP